MNASREAGRFWLLAVVIACIGGVVFFFKVGSSGFSMSEGHRVAPAWEMLRTHDWFMPHMFEQAYLRKPPGMPWAIALSTSVFGHTEFAARAVSGVSMILAGIASAWFARRWFGNAAGLAAGLAHVLMPWMWESGRAAEIEALNNLGTALAVWGWVDLLGQKQREFPFQVIALAAIGVFVAAIAKGPASLPVILAVPVSACLVARGLTPLKSRWWWIAVAASAVMVGTVALLIVRRSRLESGPIITQGVEEFLWSVSKAPQILLLPIVFLLSSMPVSLALAPGLFARELDVGSTRLARILSVCIVLAVLVYTVAGVSNPRYTLPAAAAMSPLLGFAIESWKAQARNGAKVAEVFEKLARPALLLLLLSAIGYAIVGEKARTQSSGRAAGIELGGAVEDGATIFANDMIEARPEVLLYAIDEAARVGKRVRARWIPGLTNANASELRGDARTYLLLRSDGGSSEVTGLSGAGVLSRFEIMPFHASIGAANRPFEMTLYRSR